MRRRAVLRQIGTGTAIATAGTGLAAGESVRWTFADGRTETLTLDEFDAHPATPSVASLRTDAAVSPECCCCKTVPENCADCSPCPCEETTVSETTLTLARD